MTRKAFDFSNFSGVPTPSELADLRALDYNTGLVGASFNPALARLQIAALVAGGFRVEVYGWLRHPWNQDLLDNALSACKGFPVERFWLDVEDAEDATGKTPAQLAFDVSAALAYLRPRLTISIGIYTGDWFWNFYMETNHTWDCELWLAFYVDDFETSGPIVPQGGWTTADLAIWQWRNHLTYPFNADDDLIFKEPNMTPDETAAAIKSYVDPKVAALLGNAIANGADITRHGAQIVAIGRAFADHVQAGGTVDADLLRRVAEAEKQQADLVDRVKRAAAVLTAPVV